ncbi:MAG: LysM peptidoglycan-binding domain-containing protein [Bacteroidales bacterium]|nr:LysM peptidoglycan-binding domain-containing protein [Bacteroidales bacterium]
MKKTKHCLILILCVLFSLYAGGCLHAQNASESYGIHVVQQGQTLYSIAKNYFLSVDDVLEANKGLDKSNIKTGQSIKIPLTVRNSSLFEGKNKKQIVSEEINTDALFPAKNKNKSKTDATLNKNRRLKVALLLPLFYENIDELAFNQYNIDERRTGKYKCFSYIGFYEGARIALDNLEKQGYNVSLYVFDSGEDDTNKVNKALQYPQMKEMDMIVPLVFKNSFNLISKFSGQNAIPLINPMSQNDDILSNKYVFKIQPDAMALSSSLIKYIEQKQPSSHILVIFDDKTVPMQVVNYWKEMLPKITDKWTILNYRKSAGKIKNYISKTGSTFVVNLINKTNEKENKAYAQSLINTLLQTQGNITLFADYSWMEFTGNDYKKLQDLNFHFAMGYYNDYTNPNFANFVKQYRDNFKTDPDRIYASIGYDIMSYFIPLSAQKGGLLTENPEMKDGKHMINRYRFYRKDSSCGWQNRNTTIYKIEDYKIKSEWNY